MVSVIIPSYNHSKYLKQRIASDLSQTNTDFELIMLDDCSPDDSRDVIEKYRNNPKVTNIVFNETNSGSVFKQWKKGIELAKGEFVWIAESDDYAENTFLSKLVTVLEQDNEIGLVYCNSKIVYEGKEPAGLFKSLNDLRKYMFKTTLWDNSFTMDGLEFLEKYLSQKCIINNASSVLFRKSVLNESISNLDTYKYAGDYYVYLNIAFHNKIAFINELLSNYRDHDNNASKNAMVNNTISYEYYSIISKYFEYLKNNDKNVFKYLFKVRRSFLHILVFR
jgi:glycosyltransferase involved in cell wall biosynthesis